MSNHFFRDARRADLPAILALMDLGAPDPSAISPADPNNPSFTEAFLAIQNDPNHRLIVVESDHTVIGTLQISYIPGLSRTGIWRALLESVHIHPDLRGSGIGSDLIKWAISESRKRGCSLVQLTSNKVRKDAHRFYLKLGFAQSHEGFKLEL